MKTAAETISDRLRAGHRQRFPGSEEPRQFSIGSTQLVRGDFSQAAGNAAVFQTSLVILEKGYEVSFTFIGGSEDEINELIEKLSFACKNRRADHR